MHKKNEATKVVDTQSQVKTILEMKNITKTFLGGKIIANDKVSLKLNRGEVLSIVGENGSGKSTLMNILFGMYKQDSGLIYYEGSEVDMYASGAAAKFKIGMVHQHFHLVDKMTVLENVLVGQEKIEVDYERLVKAKKKKENLTKLLAEFTGQMEKWEVLNFKLIQKLDEEIGKSVKESNKIHIDREKNTRFPIKKAKMDAKLKANKAYRAKLRNEIKVLLNSPNVKQANNVFVELEKSKYYIATAQTEKAGFINKRAAIKRFEKITEKYGIDLQWDQRIADLSVGQRQKVEILKVLWTDKNIVVFDEPTSTLSVEEIKQFLLLIEKLQYLGVSIIFISHKLAEIKEVSNRVVVLNKGKFMGSYTNNKSLTIKKIANLMVGSDIELKFPKRKLSTKKVLEVEGLRYKDKKLNKKLVRGVSFDVREGEVFGLAGIEGNGQEEVIEILSGLMKQDEGTITFRGEEIQELSVLDRNKFISHVPTDRFKHGIIPNSDLTFNSFITSLADQKYIRPYSTDVKLSGRRLAKIGFDITNTANIKVHTDTIIKRMNVEGAYSHTIPIKDLSGGNQQKFIIGRELEKEHGLMLAGHPTRGLDINAIRNIYSNIIEDSKGKATVLFSLEITELLAVCDRLAVFHEGKIMAIIDPWNKKQVENLPQLMVGVKA